MSSAIARTHTNQSNRAKDTLERKVVYKSVLENPFQIQWPRVPDNVQNAVFAQILAMLDGVAGAQRHIQLARRKRKREQAMASLQPRKKTKLPAAQGPDRALATEPGLPPAPNQPRPEIESVVSASASAPTLPSILKHVTFGINEVTKLLETSARAQRTTLAADGSGDATVPTEVEERVVAVCRADVDPAILIGHIPNLVAACNSVKTKVPGIPRTTWLVPLPKGAEESLSKAMGLRRVACIAIDSSAPPFSDLRHLLGSVPVLSASWLCPPSPSTAQTLIPTHIKQLKTTAPKDMRAAKELRAQGKAEARKRKEGKPKHKKKKPETVSIKGAASLQRLSVGRRSIIPTFI